MEKDGVGFSTGENEAGFCRWDCWKSHVGEFKLDGRDHCIALGGSSISRVLFLSCYYVLCVFLASLSFFFNTKYTL